MRLDQPTTARLVAFVAGLLALTATAVARADDWQVSRSEFDPRIIAPLKDQLRRHPEDTALLRRLIGEDVELVTLPSEEVGRVEVAPPHLEQVIVNLAVNARDAMPDGGTLTIETSNVDIDEAYERSHTAITAGRYVMLAVSDTGCGMDRETQARIFEPFFTTKPRGKGTGLGLATASVIVRDHGGHIEVDSERGKGTSFRVYLPAAQVKPVVRPRITQDHYSPVKGTVLLADDEELVRYATRRVLEHAGVKVLAAEDGAKAVDLYVANRDTVELVILDLDMPNMNGEQAFKRLVEIDPEVKVIISSGYVLRERESQLRKAGVYGFLNKPYDSMTLMTTIAKALRERRAGP